MSYAIENRPASKNGYHTPAEARAYYKRLSYDHITIHWWDSPDRVKDSDHDNVASYIMAKAARGIGSIHYVVSNKKITKMVDLGNVAWHAQKGNSYGPGIECSPHLDAEGYKKTGYIVHLIEKHHGRTMKLVPHKYWYNTACNNLDLNRIRHEANKWKSGAYNAPAKAKDEMITSKDQAIKIYKMLRPNREPSKGELDHTVNKRSYAQFVNDAQKEITERDEMFRAKDAKIRDLVNELQTAKTQAAELMQRPTIEAYQQLQDQLGSCQTKVIEASRPVDPIVIDTSEPETPKAPKLSLLAQIILWLDGRRKKA